MVNDTKSKKSTRNKKTGFAAHLPQWVKTYWWFFALMLIPAFMVVQMIISVYADTENLNNRLQQINGQLSEVYSILDSGSEPYVEENSMKKQCSRDYHGFNWVTRCGTYIEVNAPAGDMQHISNILSYAGFLDVRMVQNEGSNTGRIDFTNSDNATCRDYWQPIEQITTNKLFIKHSIHCIIETPDYVPGYEIID